MGAENTFTIDNSFSTLQSLKIFVKFLKKQEKVFDEKWPRVTFLLSHYTHVFDPWWSTALSCKRTEIVWNIIKTMWLNNNDILQTFHKFNNNQFSFYDIDLDHFTYVYTCPYIDVFVSYFFFLKNNMYKC